jgi:uncharacterized membrane protein YhaH (DUF805 family)
MFWSYLWVVPSEAMKRDRWHDRLRGQPLVLLELYMYIFFRYCMYVQLLCKVWNFENLYCYPKGLLRLT